MAIIDADAHVLESEHTWDYLLESEREFRPKIVATPNDADSGGESWLVDGRLHGKARNVGGDTPRESREMADIAARIRHMDDLEVDVQVLYPTMFLRPFTRRPEVELALVRSYNRWLTDIWKSAPERLRWVVVLPLLSMDKALEELRWSKENGACGVFVRGVEGERRLSNPYFFPLYEEASRLDMPVCVHSATGNFMMHDFFEGECGFNRFKLAVVGAFHTVLFDGVTQRFPRLKFGFIEVSAQWVPYALHDIARRLQRRNKAIGKDAMRENRIYVACQTDDDLPYILKYSGDNNIVIGSDYGHADTASELDALRNLKQTGELGAGVIDKILGDNPKALYSL